MDDNKIIESWKDYNKRNNLNISLDRYKEKLKLNPTAQVISLAMDLVAKDVHIPKRLRQLKIEEKQALYMKNLKSKLLKTLSPFFEKFNDPETKEFITELIIRDVKEEMKPYFEKEKENC